MRRFRIVKTHWCGLVQQVWEGESDNETWAAFNRMKQEVCEMAVADGWRAPRWWEFWRFMDTKDLH
jgi:hypothetical protein